MHIHPLDLDPSDDDVAGVHRVLAAATAVDRPDDPPPLLVEIAGRLRTRRTERRTLRWVARDAAGALVGLAALRLSDVDNPHLGQVELTVHPDSRRQGIGTALARTAAAAVVADGRRVVITEADEGSAAEHLCRGLGMRLVATDRMSLLRLADVDWADVERAAAAPHPGYRLERWTDRCPDDLLPRYVVAKSAMNDAPVDDVDYGDVAYSATGVRENEAAIRLQFDQFRAVVAVHEETGEVAGLTELYISTQPHRSHQGDTGVVAAHRGSGLGLWLKADMLVRLRDERPDVAELLTGNAASNEHMLRINTRLGYRPYSTMLGFQRELAGNPVGADR